MIRDVINELKKYIAGKKNTDKIKISVLVLNRLIFALEEQESKTGHWRYYEGMRICSKCGTEFYDDIMEYCDDDLPKCCPHCGCRMVEPQERSGEE